MEMDPPLDIHYSDHENIVTWIPQRLICDTNCRRVFVILNRPIENSTATYLKRNWESAALKIAVDGGLNQLSSISSCPLLTPDIIVGDMDSVARESLLKFNSVKAKDIIHINDQTETDFMKVLMHLPNILRARNLFIDAVIAIGDSGGRMDHTLGNLHTLYSASKYYKAPVFLLCSTSVSWLLEPGKHKIAVSQEMKKSGTVGLLPVGEPCFDVTTLGLKWNLQNDALSFGDLVSVCNEFDGSDTVIIETDKRLLWTMTNVFL